ncbi:Metacaspase-1 [Phlyctochytrium arcticum]|nr:Metacaspase-1 [Phlyctochytrium arcticum]
MYPGQFGSQRPPQRPPQQFYQPPPGGYAQAPQQQGFYNNGYPPPQQQQQGGYGGYAPPPQPPAGGGYGQYNQPQYAPPGGPPRDQSANGYAYDPNGPPPPAYAPPVPHVPPPANMPPAPSGPYEPVVHHRPPPPPTGWPQQQPQWQQPNQQYFQQTAPYLSTCSGNKKALLVGVNYKGTKSELRGCINDVQNMKNFLTTKFGFRDDPEHMLCLTDDQTNWHLRPMRQNILQAMQWLVRGCKAGDSLFFHFSGHGSQQADTDGDESDGQDETICPEDYAKAGMITDDVKSSSFIIIVWPSDKWSFYFQDMNAILVRSLPPGVRMTALFDCCHSGSSLDLPFTYLPDGRLKEKTAISRLGGAAKTVGEGFLRGGVMGAGMSLFKAANSLGNLGGGPSKEQLQATKGNQFADVVMISGCKDTQTSADATIAGNNTGAMTYAFTTALSQYHSPAYGQLLGEIRNLLQGKFSQRPQLSTGRMMDMNQIFIM